jgi:tetratricopeptide (TPR) repeat protein
MMLSYNGLLFDSGMRCIRQPDGSELAFTRQERSLLLELTRRPGNIVSRQELVEVLSQTGRSASLRNVDFLVNRLRQRLGDDARAPRFVATQYGEGYVWIARADPTSLDAYVVIGPVRGDTDHHLAQNFMRSFPGHLASFFGRQKPVVVELDFSASSSGSWVYGVEVSLVVENDILHAALAMRGQGATRTVSTLRCAMSGGDVALEAIAAARWARGAIWRHIAYPDDLRLTAPSDVPLEVRLQQASRALVAPTQMWRAGEEQLKLARQQSPDDPSLAILWSLNQLARLIHWPLDAGLREQGAVEALEAEIERQVLGNLDAVEDVPLLKLAAAKMLFFINRGHHELAEQLADEAFASSTAFAAAFATQGQLLMCGGRIGEAVRIYDRGLELSEFGSEFQAYLLVLKATALMALGDRQGVGRVAAELFSARPASRELSLFFASDESALDPVQQIMLGAIAPEQARLMLLHLLHTSARHFRAAGHRANVLSGLTGLLAAHFGPGVVPSAVAAILAARDTDTI